MKHRVIFECPYGNFEVEKYGGDIDSMCEQCDAFTICSEQIEDLCNYVTDSNVILKRFRPDSVYWSVPLET